jgi:hypothetical protein
MIAQTLLKIIKNSKEHRHDQSILSCLCKIYNSEKLSDETYFEPYWEVDGVKYLIWAKRNRG